MKQDEIIEMAREAGFVEYELDDGTTGAFDKRYESFAKLVAAKEREACAKLCVKLTDDWLENHHPVNYEKAIRARGEA